MFNRFNVSTAIILAFITPFAMKAEIVPSERAALYQDKAVDSADELAFLPEREPIFLEINPEQYDIEQRSCLYMTVYGEARGESPLGQELVANIILNRVESNSYPNTICEVVKQPYQFSMWADSNADTTMQAFRSQPTTEVIRAIHAGVLAIEERRILPSSALHYHADYVNPKWAKSFTKYTQTDQHIFYISENT